MTVAVFSPAPAEGEDVVGIRELTVRITEPGRVDLRVEPSSPTLTEKR